jgi:hypothetical protein
MCANRQYSLLTTTIGLAVANQQAGRACVATDLFDWLT